MGLGHGADIVRNGLVLHLDAANVKSYPGTGTTWNDLSGSGNNGTLINGVGYNSANKGVMSFDGTNTYVIVNDSNTLTNTTNSSIEVLVKSADVQSRLNDIIGKGDNDGNEEYGLVFYSYLYYDIGGGGPYTSPSYTFLNNIWYHITAVHTRTSGTSLLELYINGNKINSSVVSPTAPPNNNSLPLSIGRRFYNSDLSSRTFNGSISTVKLYSKSLNSTEIRQNFEATRGRYGI